MSRKSIINKAVAANKAAKDPYRSGNLGKKQSPQAAGRMVGKRRETGVWA